MSKLTIIRTLSDLAAAEGLLRLLPGSESDVVRTAISDTNERGGAISAAKKAWIEAGNLGSVFIAQGAWALAEDIPYGEGMGGKAKTLAVRVLEMNFEPQLMYEADDWLVVTETVDRECVEQFYFAPDWRDWLTGAVGRKIKAGLSRGK